jgi:hypothetical protein
MKQGTRLTLLFTGIGLLYLGPSIHNNFIVLSCYPSIFGYFNIILGIITALLIGTEFIATCLIARDEIKDEYKTKKDTEKKPRGKQTILVSDLIP